MNEKHLKKYVDTWGAIQLSESSRAGMQNELLAYARFHPVSEEGARMADGGSSVHEVPSGTSFISLIRIARLQQVIATLLVVLLVGGGTSYAAEETIPGDILYAIKVDFNENVRSALAFSNEAEAQLQADFAKERLEEAEVLAVRGRLDTNTSSGVRTRLAAHYKEATTRSTRAEAGGDFETPAAVQASLEGTFRTYADILSRLDATVAGNDGTSLVSDIREYATVAAEAQTTATAKVSGDVKSHVEATVLFAERTVREAKAELANVRSQFSAEAYARIEARVNEAAIAQTHAEEQIDSKRYQNAYVNAQTAIQVATESKTMVSSALRLHANTGESNNGLINLDIDANGTGETDSGIQTTGQNTKTDNTEQDTQNESDATIDVSIDADTSVDTNTIEPILY